MNHRFQFLRALDAKIRENQILLLKFLGGSLESLDPHSDLDLWVSPTNAHQLAEFAQHHLWVYRCEIKRRSYGLHLYLYFRDRSFLQIDLLWSLQRKGLEYLPERCLKKARRMTTEGWMTYETPVLFKHVVLFHFLNYSGLPEKYLHFFGGLSEGEQWRLISNFNYHYSTDFIRLNDLATFCPIARKRMVNALKQLPENRFFRRFLRSLGYAGDLLRQIGEKRGALVTFSGVDGAGKSTVLNAVKTELELRYRRKVVVIRHRPSILPILSAWRLGAAEAEARAAHSLPRQGANRSRLSSLLRFGYYLSDYLIGQYYVRLRYLWQGYVVLYDRYFFDFIIDGRRSNLDLPRWLTQWCYRLIDKPGLNIFLYAAPETILARKQELTEQDIRQLTCDYYQLFEDLGRRDPCAYLALENREVDKVFNKIIDRFLKFELC